jgi:HEAT repeat protein
MNEQEWNELVAGLRDVSDVDRACHASETLHKVATLEDLPRLMELLKDADCFVREAAAFPVADLGGPEALPELLEALQLGFDQGHDNDSFQAALTDLVYVHPFSAKEVLLTLAQAPDPKMRENANWLLDFLSE